VTYAPQIEKSDALIDWERDSAETVARKVRAYNPWPVAYSYLDGQPLRIFECLTMPDVGPYEPGVILATGDGFAIGAADGGAVAPVVVQGPGGKPMAAATYVRGHAGIVGKRLRAIV
jgi:methionyl-tRNA formyltransferase